MPEAGVRMRSVAAGVKRALETAGLYRGLLAAHPYCGVAVLAYHGVRADALPPRAMRFEELHVRRSRLDAHCRILRDLHCTPIALRDWQAMAAGVRPVPPRAVMITFDDGYRTVLTEALPVLERYGIPATVFVCTMPIERGVRFWFDALAERDGEAAVGEAKSLDYDPWAQLAAQVETPARSGDPHAPLSIFELQQLAAHPLVTVGAHTETHPVLARASHDIQRAEIGRSRLILEAWLGRPVAAFAYPNGRPGVDFTAATAAAVQACGIEDAFAVDSAFADPSAARYAHPRFLMLDTVDATELAHRLAVAWPRMAGQGLGPAEINQAEPGSPEESPHMR